MFQSCRGYLLPSSEHSTNFVCSQLNYVGMELTVILQTTHKRVNVLFLSFHSNHLSHLVISQSLEYLISSAGCPDRHLRFPSSADCREHWELYWSCRSRVLMTQHNDTPPLPRTRPHPARQVSTCNNISNVWRLQLWGRMARQDRWRHQATLAVGSSQCSRAAGEHSYAREGECWGKDKVTFKPLKKQFSSHWSLWMSHSDERNWKCASIDCG